MSKIHNYNKFGHHLSIYKKSYNFIDLDFSITYYQVKVKQLQISAPFKKKITLVLFVLFLFVEEECQ